jgi:hypothetical protein
MSDFTHVIEVVATMDDGSTVRMSNSYVIGGVLHAAQYEIAGKDPAFPEPGGESPDFLVVMNRGRNAFIDLQTTADNFGTDMSMNDCLIIHGPEIATYGDGTATANIGVYDAISSGTLGSRASVITLNKTAS